ncbi:uncharacterized protein CTRU02_203791 [Colletotrichum truncatum]|uniref:Uncharacterized protein n=1 Tax=Colletotrichum truncatum TaxID=5467 RepID=A0ACC3ZAY0_COLTU
MQTELPCLLVAAQPCLSPARCGRGRTQALGSPDSWVVIDSLGDYPTLAAEPGPVTCHFVYCRPGPI